LLLTGSKTQISLTSQHYPRASPMTIHQTGDQPKVRLTRRGRVAISVLVVLVGLIVGMATAGWSF